MKQLQKLFDWFNRAGDFAQRLQGVIWLATLLIGGILFAVGYLIKFHFSNYPLEVKSLIYFIAMITFGLTVVILLVYVVTLKIKQRAQNQNVKNASEEAAIHLLEEEYWQQITYGDRAIDNFVISELQLPSSTQAQKRANCLNLVMTTCQQNILPQIIPSERRVAFLEYPQTGDAFTLVAGCGIEHDTRAEVKNTLTTKRGVAAKAIESEEVVYLRDITNHEEAAKKGYIQVGRKARFRSIVCVGVWLDGRPLGVICADCKERFAFIESDIQVLEFCIRKVQLIYALYPLI